MVVLGDNESVKAGYGTVLVRPLKDNNHIRIGDTTVYLDPTFQKEKHSITCGEVISVTDQIDDSLQTSIEVQIGDIVFFHYLCTINAVRDKQCIVCGDQIFYSVPYGSLYVAERKIIDPTAITPKDYIETYDRTGMLPIHSNKQNEVLCLNGYILVEPIKKYSSDRIGKVLLPESMMKEEVTGRGRIAFMGAPLQDDKVAIRMGEEIIYRKSSSVPLQFDLHASFKGGNKYFRMKRESVLAVVN